MERLKLMSINLGIALLVFSGVVLASQQLYDAIAAVVEGKVVSVRQVIKRMEQTGVLRSLKSEKEQDEAVMAAFRQALDSLIDDILLDIQVEKAKIKVGDDEVEAYMRRIMAANKIKDFDKFKSAVEAQGFNWQQFWEMKRKQIARQRFLSFKVGRDAKVEDSEVEAEYKRRKKEAEKQIICTITYALVSSKNREIARQAAEWLVQNSTPTQLKQDALTLESNLNENAKDESEQVKINVYSASHEFNEWIKQFQEVCASTKVGSMNAQVINFEDKGFIAAGLLERKHKQYPPLEQVKRDIWLELYSKRFEQLTRRYLDSLRRKSVIKLYPIAPQTVVNLLGLR